MPPSSPRGEVGQAARDVALEGLDVRSAVYAKRLLSPPAGVGLRLPLAGRKPLTRACADEGEARFVLFVRYDLTITKS
jgi:hypothetical protein